MENTTPIPYWNDAYVVTPYRLGPISPPCPFPGPQTISPKYAGAAAAKVQLMPVDEQTEPGAMAVWFVGFVRDYIGPENTEKLKEIIQTGWDEQYACFFRDVATYRKQQASPPEGA